MADADAVLTFRLDPDQVAEIQRRVDEVVAREVAPVVEERDRLRACEISLLQTVAELRGLIGEPPPGAPPAEQFPRDRTWHEERQNWIGETRRLRTALEAALAEIDRLRATEIALLQTVAELRAGAAPGGRRRRCSPSRTR